jgi:sarcosine oxidase subunit gamma
MSTEVSFKRLTAGTRLGFKGAGAGAWLAAQGVGVPAASNTWSSAAGVLTARLGSAEYFLAEQAADAGAPADPGSDAAGTAAGFLRRIAANARARPAGVYPVLREDWDFVLEGRDVHSVLAQVCNVNFADVQSNIQPVIMTLMIGVAVLVVPRGAAGRPRYRIWCDPSYGPYLSDALGTVVVESGGMYRGATE